MPQNWIRTSLAELIGTFALTFIGILAITNGRIIGAAPSPGDLTTVALAHGLTIAVMVAALGATSGAHFNPAVTFGFVVTRRMDVLTGVRYIVSQIVGALLASLFILLAFNTPTVVAGTPALNPNVGTGAGIMLEIVATFFLVLVVFCTAVDDRAPKGVFPLAIGFTVALDIMGIGPLTGAAMNPARVLGPALTTGAFADHLVYWVGPLVGGALAAIVADIVFIRRDPETRVGTQGGPAQSERRA